MAEKNEATPPEEWPEVFGEVRAYQFCVAGQWIRVDLEQSLALTEAMSAAGLEWRPSSDSARHHSPLLSLAPIPHAELAAVMVHKTDKAAQIGTVAWAISRLCIHLAKACADLAPGILHVHAACLSMGGITVLLLADYKSGKSSLCAALHRRGASVMADDAILIDARAGTLLEHGLPYRIRNSFLAHCHPETRAFAEHTKILADRRFSFFRTSAAKEPGRKIDLVIHIDRDSENRRELRPLSVGNALLRLLDRDIRSTLPPNQLLASLFNVFGKVGHLHYRYQQTEDAAEFLADIIHEGKPWRSLRSETGQAHMEASDGKTILAMPDWCFVGLRDADMIKVMHPATFRLWQCLAAYDYDEASALRAVYEGQPELAKELLAEKIAQVYHAFAAVKPDKTPSGNCGNASDQF